MFSSSGARLIEQIKRGRVEVKVIEKILLAIVMTSVISGAAFAQNRGRNEENRPPKADQPKIKAPDKKTPPPNNQRRKEKGEERGRGRPQDR